MRLHLLAFLLTAALAHAEPVVTSDDLPRVPPTPPDKAVATCAVRAGFRVELMAAEPLVMSPVAMAFDEDGRLYVVEMRDYSERREEKLGRVKLLEDTDGDGSYDRATVFVEGLPWPTGITCWDGGVFVLASPDLLYFKDMDGDGKADVHQLVFTGFGSLAEKLNVQQLPNSLQWGPDQRIHGALGGNPGLVQNFARYGSPKIELRGRDFSFDPRAMDLRAESGGGQFGMTFDDTGRKLVCANSRHLMQVMYEDRIAARVTDSPLPAPAIDIAADGPQAEVFRRSPEEPWRVLRTKWRVAGQVPGPVEGGGRASGYFTGATGLTVYRGDAWPAEFRGDVFIADCGSNLIHRKKLSGDLVRRGVRGEGEEKSEFVASTDNWFRPVAFANAPDGNLWVADMYREVIEHPWSLPEPLKSHLDLNSGNDRGRIYRIAPVNFTPRPAPRLSKATTPELVATLAQANGWHRDTAARLLHLRQDKSAVPALVALAEKADTPASRLLALQVLRGLDALDDATLARSLRDLDADVRAGAVRLCTNADLVTPLADDPAPRVRNQAAWTLLALAPQEKLAPLVARAIEPLLHPAAANISAQPPAGNGHTIFATRCATCHRFAGEGSAVGPDLDAARLAGREKLLGNILEPSRELTAGYPLGVVETKGGDMLSGIITNESPGGVILRLPGGGERAVKRSEIVKFERPGRSLMPDNIAAGLMPRDLDDLLDFLSGGAEILRAAQEIMGPLPGVEKACALDPQIVEEVDCGSYVRRLLTYESEPGSRVPAYLLIPKKALSGGVRVNAVLCLHPTENKLGHKVVVGLGGEAYAGRASYAAELAERGFVAIAPAYPLLANYQPDLAALGYVSGTMKAIHDNRRALDLLDSLPFVKTGRYAAIGHSLGGHNAVFTAVFDERLRIVVSSCGLDSFLDYKGGDIRGWTSKHYMPRLLAYREHLAEVPFDFPALIAALGSRTVLLSAPLHDDNFRADSVDRIAVFARPAFERLGGKLIVEHPDATHDFPDATREQAYRVIGEGLQKGE
jgi:putative membrane-bound dehydrogenase-like protein